jgi:hypothetical protein
MSVIALDLDGTIARPKWPGIGEPYPHAVAGIKALQAEGHSVYIYTTRCWGEGTDAFLQRNRIHSWLDEVGLGGLRVVAKSPYDIIVDDRALRHPPREHAWNHTPARILAQLGKL